HLENALHGILDIGLRRAGPDAEAERAVSIPMRLALFCHQRSLDHIKRLHCNASESFCAAGSDRITRSCSSRWYGCTSRLASSVTRERLREERSRFSLTPLLTNSTDWAGASRSST